MFQFDFLLHDLSMVTIDSFSFHVAVIVHIWLFLSLLAIKTNISENTRYILQHI